MADAPIDPSKVTVGQATEAVASGAAETLDEAGGVVSEAAGAVTGVVEDIKDGVSGFADDLLGDFMPKEPVCPTIPGVTFPTLPDLDKLGEIKDDALEQVDKLSERVKNPPSAKDLMEEIGNKVSDEAEKAAKALEKAARDMAEDIEKQLAEQWQKAQDAMTEIEKGVEALADGSAIKEIGADLADIPLAAVGGAFAGFKNALECLEGAVGSAKAEFTKVADALEETLENGGRGLSATAADEEITSQAEETTDENGNKIKKQKTISREDAAKSVEGTTKNAVPQSDNPIATEKDAIPEEERALKVGVSPGNAMNILTKLYTLTYQVLMPHTRLPSVFMKKDDDGVDQEPMDFVGSDYRAESSDGFTDDRVRNANNYVAYAPRKVVPDLIGGGTLVSEDYPQSMAREYNPSITEANTPRQTRGEKLDTLTKTHDARRTFDIGVASFNDTLDAVPPDDKPAAWDGKANPTTTQPENPFNARYPYNHVRETESGHLFEADDTPGAERIKESHRSGTYYEVFPDGSRVERIVRDNFTVIVGHDKVNIQGSAIVTVEGDCNFYTKGNFTQQVDGDYNLLVKGKYTEQIASEVTHDHHSNYYHYVGNAIDSTKAGQGRGNEGGSSKVEIANDHKLQVFGATTEIYGDGGLFDSNGTTTNHTTVLFGSETTIIAGGFRYDQVQQNHTAIVGGSSFNSIQGDSKTYVTGQSITRSTKETEISGSSIELNPPSPIDG